MNNNLQVESLVYKGRIELVEMLDEAVKYAQEGSEDELYKALEQIEAVTYVLKNCNYKGSSDVNA